jgi:cellulase/cellobiase CelA1
VVSYATNSWGTGFTGSVTVTNRGTAAVNGWTLSWAFPGNQSVTSAWNATVTQSGTQVTAKNVDYNATIGVNANASFGFQATYSGTNAAPGAFTLNGTACTIT